MHPHSPRTPSRQVTWTGAFLALVAATVVGHVALAQTWQTDVPLPTARAQALALTDANGKIHVFGGYNQASSSQMSTHEVFDPATDGWSTAASLPQATRMACGALAPSGKLVVIGGTAGSTQVYDPATDTWTMGVTDPQGNGWGCAAATGVDGSIYVFGGESGMTNLSIYNPATNTWTTGSALPQGRLLHQAVVLSDGKIYVFGGLSTSFTATATMDVYDPATDTWTPGAAMPLARSSLAAAPANGDKIYALDGSDSYGNMGGPFYGDVMIYDSQTGAWTTGPSDLVVRRAPTAAVAAGMLRVFGGYNSTGFLDSHTYFPVGLVASAGGPYTVTEGGTLTLTATGTSAKGNPVTFSWDLNNDGAFGDATGATVAYPYTAQVGVNTVKVKADDGTAIVTSSTTVTVNNVAPTITGMTAPDGMATQALTFSATATDPGTDTPITFTWDFGDGTATASGASVTHTYASAGTYTVTVTAADTSGGTSQKTATVTISPNAPQVTAVTVPASADEGTSVQMGMTATYAGADTVTYTWDFGDGGTGTGQTTTHTYGLPGTYTVTGTATNTTGGSTSKTASITIANVAPTLTGITAPDGASSRA